MSFYVNPHGHSCPWYAPTELVGAPNIKWCEETLCQWVSEPANTWSNIPYLIAALFIYWSANRKGGGRATSLKQAEGELLWMAPAMFIMGLGSFIYHMSNNYASQVLDFVGMFLFVFWFIILNLRRLNVLNKKNQAPVFAGLVIITTVILHVMYLNFLKIQFIVVIGVAAIALTEYLCYKKDKKEGKSDTNYRYLTIAAVIMAIAQIFSLLDLKRILCSPQNHIFQGHALWHVLGAIGLCFAYKHWEQFSYRDIHQLDFHNIDPELEI